METVKFTELDIKPEILKAVANMGFEAMSPIQAKAIPVELSGKDVIGQAQTGTGKTAAFGIPILQKVDPKLKKPQAIVLCPTRELAIQVADEIRKLAKYMSSVKILPIYGGQEISKQIRSLKAGVQIIIGTPGRIYDLVKSGDLAIHKANTFVVDEADMTLDMGFLETVDKIASSLPKELQFLVFSATIPQKLQPFLKKYLSNPVIEQIKTKTVISDTIENWLISTKGQDKNAQIYQITQLLQPYLAMIFVNTKTRADELHSYLTAQGLKVAKIHGDVPPRERKRIMNQVKNLEFEYIVATDLAARGIDIEGISHVINDAIPQDLSFFIHRVGRTGRNGLPGTAITLYQPSDDSDIRELEKLGIQFIPKMIKADEFQDTYDRDRRSNREKRQEKLDTEMIGLVKKKKKKIKPGYKKKIQWAVNEKRRKTKRAENRARGRAERKAKRQSF